MKSKPKQIRGFAAMKDRARALEIARQGGLAVSQNKAHMKNIGQIGGYKTQKVNRAARRAAAKMEKKGNGQ